MTTGSSGWSGSVQTWPSGLSIHAAMLEAGWRKRTLTLSTEPRQATKKLLEIFSPDDLRRSRRILELELLPEPEAPLEKRVPGGRTYYAVVDGEEVSQHRS